MKKYCIEKDIPKLDQNISCIGYFDGVHRGHQVLINKTIEIAKQKNLKSMVICFDPDPDEIINSTNSKHVLSLKDRLISFENLGIDEVCIIKFNKKLMNLKPETFIKKYLLKMNIDTLVFGFDFSFGFKGQGNGKTLEKYLNTISIPAVNYYNKKISTTRIKQAIYEGNFKLTKRLLGYKYSLMLEVVKVSKTKNKWLIETNNVDKKMIMPKDGKYNCYEIKNGHLYFICGDKLAINEKLLMVFDYE